MDFKSRSLLKLGVPLTALVSLNANALSPQQFWELLNQYLGKPNINSVWSMDGGWGEPQYPSAYMKYFEQGNGFIRSGTYMSEPLSAGIYAGLTDSWSVVHEQTCVQTSAFQEMPITTSPSGYTTVNGKQIKKFTVNQNVPVEFKAKTHGGLTAMMTDSLYHWNFGDGMRQFGTKGDQQWAEHRWPFLGNYTLASMVYTEEFYFGISIGGNMGGDFSVGDSNFGFDRYISDVYYLEGCDFAKVKVIPNNRPTGNFTAGLFNDSPSVMTYRLDGRSSSDPDGNPLTYTWTHNGLTRTGPVVYFSFSTPEMGQRQETVYLTVTDGDKSHTVAKNVTVTPYCYPCNGMEMP